MKLVISLYDDGLLLALFWQISAVNPLAVLVMDTGFV
jgi:hypothetical protein